MLQNRRWDDPVPVASEQVGRTGNGGLAAMIATTRRYAVPLLLWVFVCVGSVFAYAYFATPEYVSSTMVILEPKRPFLTGSSSNAPPQLTLDSSQVESQMQVVKSASVLGFVFHELKLENDPEFSGRSGALSAPAPSTTNEMPPGPKDEAEGAAFSAFADRVSVRRIGQSLVLEISVRSASAKRAVLLANSITAAYIRDQIESKRLAMQSGGDWLQGKMEDLRTQENGAVAAVLSGAPLTTAFSASDARIINSATLPRGKTYPQTRLLLVFSAGIAILSGFFFIAIFTSIDRRVWNKDQLAELGIACIAAVPRISKSERDGTGSARALTNCVTDWLRSADFIINHKGGEDGDIIGFVSCFPDEGKSTILAGFRERLSWLGKSSIMIDGHVYQHERNPELNSKIGPATDHAEQRRENQERRNQSSLTEFVSSKAAEYATWEIISQRIEMLDRSSYILIELPALNKAADALQMSRALSGVILVVEAGRTTSDHVKEALELLHRADLKLIGCVLNKVPGHELPSLFRN